MSMVEFLIFQAHRLRKLIDLERIEDQLKSDVPLDQRASEIFTAYHLLISGAVVEANISSYLEAKMLPDTISRKLDVEDECATLMAWEGTAFGKAQNIIGGLTFTFMVLFVFEAFSKLLIGEKALRNDLSKPKGMLGLNDVIDWLDGKPRITHDKLESVRFLNRYRNAWHSFGRYDGKPMMHKGLELKPGARLPVIHPLARMTLLADLFDVFLEVNNLFPSGTETPVARP